MACKTFIKRISIYFSAVLLLFLHFQSNTFADASYTASSLHEPDVQSAVDSCVADGECTIVYLPAGTSPEPWADEVDVQVPNRGIRIIGQGKDKTIINISSSNNGYQGGGTGAAFYFNSTGDFAALENVRINGAGGVSRNLVCFRWCYDAGFVVANSHFYGHATTAGLVAALRCWKGLYHGNYMEYDTPSSGTPYGFTIVGPSGMGPKDCREDKPVCELAWDKEFWEADHGGGHTYDNNWIPGTDNAVFVENSEFVNIRAAVEVNWASFVATVVRYNHFRASDQLQTFQTVVKPGNLMQVIYNNVYEWFGTGTGTQPHNGRANLIVHHNHYINIGLPGSFWPFSGTANGYLWTNKVQMDKFFVWGNTYTNCRRSGDSLYPGGWDDYSQASENARQVDFSGVPVFGRAPSIAAGDSFDYVKYTCPHPWADPQENGSCNPEEIGLSGYSLQNELSPLPPTGLKVE